MHTEELFELFFKLLDPDMHPPKLYQRGDLKMFWRERFSEALSLQEPHGAMIDPRQYRGQQIPLNS